MITSIALALVIVALYVLYELTAHFFWWHEQDRRTKEILEQIRLEREKLGEKTEVHRCDRR